MILGLQQQLKEDGIDVSLAKLCRWCWASRTKNDLGAPAIERRRIDGLAN
jgi:hypothetical protein